MKRQITRNLAIKAKAAQVGLTPFKLMITGLFVLNLMGCAIVPREEALKLAGAGKSATSALSSQFSQVIAQTSIYPELVAFNSQYDLCVDPITNLDKPNCADWQVEPATLAVTRKLNALVEKRVAAVNELGKAYAALEAEAKYEADADLSGAVGSLIGSIDGLASTAGLDRPSLAGAATQIPARLAGWAARGRQIERLKVANSIIAIATEELAAALEVEKRAYGDVLEVIGNRQTEFATILIGRGVVDRVDQLAPLVEGLGLKLALKAAEQINSSKALTQAIASSFVARRAREHAENSESYAKLGQSLRSLSRLHKSFEETGQFDLAGYTLFVTELANAVEASKPKP